MNDIIILQDELGPEYVRQIHVMSNQPVGDPWGVRIPAWAKTHRYQDEIKLHHLEAAWAVREAMTFTFGDEGSGKKHPMVVWALEPGQRISEAAVDAALLFFGTFEYWPSVAWVRTWPNGLKVEDAYIPITEDAGLDLIAIHWAMDGFVIVGGSFNRRRS